MRRDAAEQAAVVAQRDDALAAAVADGARDRVRRREAVPADRVADQGVHQEGQRLLGRRGHRCSTPAVFGLCSLVAALVMALLLSDRSD